MLDDQDVREALSVYIVDQLYRNVDVEARLEQRLPEDLDGLSAPLAGALGVRPSRRSTGSCSGRACRTSGRPSTGRRTSR